MFDITRTDFLGGIILVVVILIAVLALWIVDRER
jgi:hypothetical protein